MASLSHLQGCLSFPRLQHGTVIRYQHISQVVMSRTCNIGQQTEIISCTAPGRGTMGLSTRLASRRSAKTPAHSLIILPRHLQGLRTPFREMRVALCLRTAVQDDIGCLLLELCLTVAADTILYSSKLGHRASNGRVIGEIPLSRSQDLRPLSGLLFVDLMLYRECTASRPGPPKASISAPEQLKPVVHGCVKVNDGHVGTFSWLLMCEWQYQNMALRGCLEASRSWF